MRDAFVITISIVFISVILGVIYNLAKPYLVKLEVIEEESSSRRLLDDGGIFRSQDFGRSWNQVGAVKDMKRFLQSDVFDFQFNMQDPDVLYAATSAGLYMGVNGGQEWRSLSNGDLRLDSPVLAFAVDPKTPWRMYAAVHGKDGGRIVKSNGGDFYEVYSISGEGSRVEGVWIDYEQTSRLYASTGEGLFLVSEDFGESWKVRWEFPHALRKLSMPQSDTRIMYAVVGTGKIFKTSDRGLSWQDISKSLSRYEKELTINDIARDPHSENHLYIAASEGLFESRDGGASFVEVALLTTAGKLAVGAAAADPKNSDIIYIGVGSQIHKSTDGGRSWQTKTLATSRNIRIIVIKPDDSAIIFAGVQHD